MEQQPKQPPRVRFSIPVIYGSVRSERQGIRVARFMVTELARRGCEPALIDEAAPLWTGHAA